MNNFKSIRINKISLLFCLLLASAGASRAAANPWVAGYYAGWEASHLPITSVDMTSMDALIHFAVVPSTNGSLNATINGLSPASVTAVVTAVHAAGKKVLFTVGGAGSQAGFEGAMSSTSLTTFINNIVNFMTSNNYDGVDIDMEEMTAADVTPYITFVTALRAQMTAVEPGSLLTAAVTWEPAAFAQLTGVFDHIDLMTYSMTGGTWYNETWHDAPVYSAPAIGGGTLASVDSMFKQFTAANIPTAKLGIGITFDPYIWTGGSGVTGPQQTWTSAPTVTETYYYTIAKTYGLVEGSTVTSAAGSVYAWDSAAQASYLSVTGNPASSDAFISYDDVSAIKAKFAYANANGIGSMIIWDLAAGWRTDLPTGQQGLLLEAVKSAAYGTITSTATAAPVISSVTAYNINQTSATVSWTTNELASSQVEYGLTSAYGSSTALNTVMTTSHSAVLNGLSPSTLYYYAVQSQNTAGGLTISTAATFTTLAPPTVQASTATTPPVVQTSPFSDNFSSYTINTCFADGSAFGPWQSAFSGYGCNSVQTNGVNFWLDESPAVSTSASLTHASLSLGPSFAAPITFSATIDTNAQLRQNNPANPWEVAWVVWNYTDNNHFYYFVPQPNGWELGKEDPAYPGSQRFLATGSSPTFPIGAWYTVKIIQTQNVISAYVNGQLITTFTDTQTPYTSGSIGLYTEEAEARYENIAVNELPPVISAITVSNISLATATVSWTTNETANTQVEYGFTTAYGSTTTLSAAMSTSHSATLSGLSAGMLYHYAVQSRDIAGDLTTSPDATFTTAVPSTVLTSPFSDNFSSYTINACFADGTSFGPWTSAFSGYGCNSVQASGMKFWLNESPLASTTASESHSTLVLGPSFAAPITFLANVNTNAQLRKNTPPNPWEVAWVVWNYTDDSHFYYFVPQPNGWELGKEDPAYPGSQRFLATGTSPVFLIGNWYAVKILQTQNVISVYVNSQLITTFTDLERPYTYGNIGLYGEDSNDRFENIAVNETSLGVALEPTTPNTPSTPDPASASDEQATAQQKFISPAITDGIHDHATFGMNASAVSIYNIRGYLVFHGSQEGGAPIVWNGRDGSGRIEESGVYIAKIEKADSGVVYQSLAIVK